MAAGLDAREAFAGVRRANRQVGERGATTIGDTGLLCGEAHAKRVSGVPCFIKGGATVASRADSLVGASQASAGKSEYLGRACEVHCDKMGQSCGNRAAQARFGCGAASAFSR